uniref:hypothetical protein n=1 Tax=Cellvibrio fontiphilus TaxID=1815559 RepID=UPI002B4BB69F|nr:hypothetical protein [Cellvibrio fontiphilus]
MKLDAFKKLITYLSIVFVSTNVFAQEPVIDVVEGELKKGEILTIKGSGFTHKLHPKPLLFWQADDGEKPSPLGRKLSWDGVFNGEIVDKSITPIISPGSQKALRYDYSSGSGALLARVSFESDDLYVWRKRYDDFDRSKDFAIRTRYVNLEKLGSVSTPQPGMLMAKSDRSLWGRVIVAEVSTSDSGTIYYSNEEGNLANKSAISSMKTGDVMYFFADTDVELKTPLLRALNNEGVGVFHTFNHKIIRLWGKTGTHLNNSYISLDSDGMMVSERTQVSSFFMADWDSKISSATERWVVEEFEYRAGTINNADGILRYWQDRTSAWDDKRFRFTTTEFPNKYTEVFQTQVSNGAYPGSYEYFDSLYIDDSWHRVLVCAEYTWFACKQPEILIPVEWSDSEIKVVLRTGSLGENERFYFFVVNGAGLVNSLGFSSCPKCPEPPFQGE